MSDSLLYPLLIVVFPLGFGLIVGLSALFYALAARRRTGQGIQMSNGSRADVARPPLQGGPRLDVSQARPNSCPVCGAEVPADTPQGLCPQCLMKCVLSDSDQPPPDEEGAETGAYPGSPIAPTPAELAPHFPELEILELLGQGGMGAVYKARQRKLDRLVALKVLPSEWGRDPAFAERFAREARTLARLSHPEVVGVHDFGEAGGHYYLIMEFVDGANLRRLLANGPLQPPQALAIVGQICDALQYAHEQGVVHRDIKPENILLDRRGRVKIADFGLAKLLRRSRGEFTLTNTGQVMGTLDYMAPEQRSSPQAVDHRADIYSLGVVFYEMLTGELPLGRFTAPSAKAPVDGRLDEVIFRALEREPDRRYQRISAVKEDVESILRAELRPSAAAPRHPVRSFVHSVFSMFAPRAVLGRPAATAAVPRHTPARGPGSPSPARSPSHHDADIPEVLPVNPRDQRAVHGAALARKRSKLVYVLPLLAGLLVCSVFGLRLGTNKVTSFGSGGQDAQLEGLLIGNPDDLKTTLYLSDSQLKSFKQLLASADREYLELEQRHTSRKVTHEAGSEGHVLVTVSAFAEEASHLEDRVWAQLFALNPSLSMDMYRKQLPAKGALFAFGKEETRIEIWEDDSWFYWKVTRPLPGDQAGLRDKAQKVIAPQAPLEEGNGAQLPRRYQRFWQGGPP